MIVVLKATLGSLVIFAAAVAIAIGVGLLLFNSFGAVTMVVVYSLACIAFLTVYAGYATGTIAANLAPNHPVAAAFVTAVLLWLANFGSAKALSLTTDWVPYLLPVTLLISVSRAWRLGKRQRKEA